MPIQNLICPKCQSELIRKGNNIFCNNCNSVFPIVNGIVNFLVKNDNFYEGKFGTDINKMNFLKKWLNIVKIYLSISAFGFRTKHMKFYQKLN